MQHYFDLTDGIPDWGTRDGQRLGTVLRLLDSVTSAPAEELGGAEFATDLVAIGVARKVEGQPGAGRHRLWRTRGSSGAAMPSDYHGLQTPRSTLRDDHARVLVWCKACQDQADANLEKLVRCAGGGPQHDHHTGSSPTREGLDDALRDY